MHEFWTSVNRIDGWIGVRCQNGQREERRVYGGVLDLSGWVDGQSDKWRDG